MDTLKTMMMGGTIPRFWGVRMFAETTSSAPNKKFTLCPLRDDFQTDEKIIHIFFFIFNSLQAIINS